MTDTASLSLRLSLLSLSLSLRSSNPMDHTAEELFIRSVTPTKKKKKGKENLKKRKGKSD